MEKILHVLCTVIYAVIILIYNDTRSSKHVALFIGVRTECVCVGGGGGGGTDNYLSDIDGNCRILSWVY